MNCPVRNASKVVTLESTLEFLIGKCMLPTIDASIYGKVHH